MIMDTENKTLTGLNEEEARQYFGGVVFVSVLMFFGIFGNLHVLFVYSLFMKPSNHRLFILVLGCMDFITCVVGMPFILVDLHNPLTFTLTLACKVLRFINYFVCSASALILVVIATERYKKICGPLGKQLRQRDAKLLILLVLGIALLISWPAPILYGVAPVPTSDPTINGSRCFTEDKEDFEKYQGYFNAALIVVIMVVFLCLVVLYCLIWRVIVKHNHLGNKVWNKNGNVPKLRQEANEISSDFRDSPVMKHEDRNECFVFSVEQRISVVCAGSLSQAIVSSESGSEKDTRDKGLNGQKPEICGDDHREDVSIGRSGLSECTSSEGQGNDEGNRNTATEEAAGEPNIVESENAKEETLNKSKKDHSELQNTRKDFTVADSGREQQPKSVGDKPGGNSWTSIARDLERISGDRRQQSYSRAKRTTLMFLLITAVFFLSYFPHLSLKVLIFFKQDFLTNLSFEQKLVYNTVVWSFFINNMANAFIYGFFDMRFRGALIHIYGKLCGRT